MGDRLRQLWDFDDLDASRERLTEQLERETSDIGQAEVLTQLARVAGLAGDVDGAYRLLDRAGLLGAGDVVVRARVALERGRALRSSGNEAEAAPAFAEAYDLAREADDAWLAADAAHMLAIVATSDEDRETWTGRGVDAAESSPDPADAYWVGPLMNNLGWSYLEGRRAQDALETFERALAVREREPDHPYEIEIARFAVAKALLALGRATDAIPLLERAIAWADASGTPDGWFLEALAEAEGVLGRDAEAAAHARTALELLAEQDPQLAEDAARADRLRELASPVDG